MQGTDNRSNFLSELLGPEARDRIDHACILVVGAGGTSSNIDFLTVDLVIYLYLLFIQISAGIGCEVLKNLVMCSVPNIHVIDLDTIGMSHLSNNNIPCCSNKVDICGFVDVSNLNRQFLVSIYV